MTKLQALMVSQLVFTKFFWNRLKAYYFNAVSGVLARGKLYDSAATGIITLIPKKDRDLLLINNWRPITLLNVDFKILTKALANRMKGKFPFLIDSNQLGYMQGRNIAHNIRRTLDIIQVADARKLAMVILSVDYEKCYDRVAHIAIDDSLKYFNFGDKFRHFVRICLQDSMLTVLNNGHFSEYFKAFRGIKQGDCLSLYLALLVMEQLSIRVRANDKIRGISINNKENKLAQFADDLNMFLMCEFETLMEVTQAFEHFERETDFRVNYNKTSVYRIGSLKDSNAKIYTGKALNWTNTAPVILGIPIDASYEEIFCKEIEKAKQICRIWSVRSLSLIGKVTIVNTLIGSLFVYKMQVLNSVKDDLVNEFEQMVKNFLWGENKRVKIKLATLYNTKEYGGLKLVNLIAKDKSLKIKWVSTCKMVDKIRDLACEFLPSIGNDFWMCNLNHTDVRALVGPGFWQDVALAWSNYNYHDPRDKEEVVKEFLWLC